MIMIGLAGLALMPTRWKRVGACMAGVSLFLLAVAGFSPIGNLLTQALERRFPQWDAARSAPDGIVVLGGAIASKLSRDYGEPIVGGNADRIIAMAKLARTFPNARIVYSGGDASLFGDGPRESDFVHPLLDSLGIARERVLLESRSRNTVENAAFTKELLKPKPDERWLLVTSAQHMPRAVGCFRRVGFPVEAFPVDWHTAKTTDWKIGSLFSGGLARLDSAAYEWIGLFAYWLTGKTSELFPAP
jgi:uncharacterized SAM-binding protein YcdF (DUF218 family)